MKVALLIPQVRARDYSLLPARRGSRVTAPGPETSSGVSPATNRYTVYDGQYNAEIEEVHQAVLWARDRIADGYRVYSLEVESIVAQYLWYEREVGREYPTVGSTLDLMVEWIKSGLLVPMLDLTDTVADMTGRFARERAVLYRDASVEEIHAAASAIETFMRVNFLGEGEEWPASVSDIEKWLATNERRRDRQGGKTGLKDTFPLAPPQRNGCLGTAASIFGLAAGLVMSWHGINANLPFLREQAVEDLTPYVGEEREALRKISAAFISVRPDGRYHPFYSLQAFKRLEARNPRYAALSGRGKVNERKALIADKGDSLYSIDVSLAELFVTGLYWQRLFGHHERKRAPALIARLEEHVAGTGPDMHEQVGSRLMELAGREDLVGSPEARRVGKSVNFALGNLGSVQTIADRLSTRLGFPIDEVVVCNVLRELANEYPYERWKSLCQSIAFRSGVGEKAVVPSITGRWLTISARKGRRKPAPTLAASAMTQSTFADIHAFGLFEAIRRLGQLGRGWVVGSVADEMLVSAPDREAVEIARQGYIAGASRLMPNFEVRTEIQEQGAFWGA